MAQDADIRSVQCFVGDNEMSNPVMDMHSTAFLTLWFDDFNEKRDPLNYTIVHCDADWNEDRLFIQDYMTGFAENPLRDYALSFRTRTNYTHYSLQIPNEDVSLKVSGNYLIKIYENDPGKPLLVQRFSLYENMVDISLHIRGPVLTGEDCLQQLVFSVHHPSLPVRDALREFKVRVMQNGIPLPDVENPSPSFVEHVTVSYSLATQNWYPGGNEYRSFDIRNLDFGAQGVGQVRYDNAGIPYALLQVDEPRDHKPYSFVHDINGKFKVEANRTNNYHTEAEYVMTGFTLASEELSDGEVFVFGQLSNYALRREFAMTYNYEKNLYELNVALKQAYYNYRYLFVPHNAAADWTAIEGCFAETENYYTVFVYYRSFRDKYDRLAGIHTATVN